MPLPQINFMDVVGVDLRLWKIQHCFHFFIKTNRQYSFVIMQEVKMIFYIAKIGNLV